MNAPYIMPEQAEALDHARHLAAHGVPVFVAPPALDAAGRWTPAGGTGGTGYDLPKGWAATPAEPATLDAWRPGWAVAAVMGAAVDGLDVDPRHGGDATAAGWVGAGLYPASYGQQTTPSGGWHELIAPLGVGSRDDAAPGVDLKGGRGDGSGRGFLFLAPTVRLSKATGELAPYRWTVPPDLDALDRADDTGAWLADRIGELRSTPVARQATPADRAQFDSLDPAEQARVRLYLDAAVGGIGTELTMGAGWPVGHRDDRKRGWQKVVADAAYRLGSLARAPWTPWSLDDAYATFAGIVPVVVAAAVPPAREWAAQAKRGPAASFPARLSDTVRKTDRSEYAAETPQDAPGAAHAPGLATDTPDASDAPGDPPPSWAPVDLGPVLDGTQDTVRPTLLPRSDGVALVYPGLTHSFHGESESGKSLVLQVEAVRLLGAGERVLFVDFESDAGSVVGRLLEFGATPAAIRDRFVYLRPEVRPDSTARELAAWLDILTGRFALAIVDGVTDSLGIFGYSTKDNDDVTRWSRELPRRIADRTGAAVVVVDHVTKDADSRGRFAIGGQAKLSGLTGAAYTVEVARPLGRGLRGVVVLRVGKDRPGYVRGHAGPMRTSDRTQEVARVVVDSTGPAPLVTVEPWKGNGNDPDAPAARWRPTALMEKLSRALEAAPGALKFRDLDGMVQGKAEHKRTALAELDADGYIAVTMGPNRANLHTSTKPYRQADDPGSDMFEPRDTHDPPGTPSDPSNGCVRVSLPNDGVRDTHTGTPLGVSGTHTGHTRDTHERDPESAPRGASGLFGDGGPPPFTAARCRSCEAPLYEAESVALGSCTSCRAELAS